MKTKTFEYSEKLYNKFLEDSTPDTLRGIKVWQGRTVQTATDVGIPSGYYSRVMRALTVAGCIGLVQRGAGSVLSIVELYRPPVEATDWRDRPDKSDLTTAQGDATLAQRVEDLARLVGGTNIGEALWTLTQELRQLDRRLTRLESGGTTLAPSSTSNELDNFVGLTKGENTE